MKRVLSLDGGGIKGLIEAVVLMDIRRRTGRPILECFDLVAGTSTGGMIALMIAAGYEPEDIATLYVSRGGDIFGRKAGLGGFRPKYSASPLESILAETFGARCLSESAIPTVVTSYDLLAREEVLFRSWQDKIPMTAAGRATSAAEVFFPAHEAVYNGKRRLFADGGTWANNPAAHAAAEAIALWPDEQIIVVSLGAGENTRPLEAKKWGAVQWVLQGAPLVNVFMDGQSDGTCRLLRLMLGDRFFRLQTRLDVAKDDMDDASTENLLRLVDEALSLISRETETLDRLCQQLVGTALG